MAFATLADGTSEGQIKILKMKSRGQYSLDGVTFFKRYVEVTLTLNGATTTLDVSDGTNNTRGSHTLIWHDGSWWIINEFKTA